MLAYGSVPVGAGRGRSAVALQTMNALFAGMSPAWKRSTFSGVAVKSSARYRSNPVADVRTSVFPSGDQRGALLSMFAGEIRVGDPPLVVTTHTSDRRLFSASRTVVTVNATHLPSGDIAGWRTVVTRYQSASVNARLVD